MTETHRYHADVTLRMRIMVTSTSTDAALEDARRAALRRPGVRPEHITGVHVTPLSDAEQRELGNLHAWQERQALHDRGSSDQRTRWISCLLPEEELLHIARSELFRPFGLLVKRRPMAFADIDHPKNTSNLWTCVPKMPVPGRNVPRDLSELVDWATVPVASLTEDEHRTLLRVHEGAAEVLRHPWMKNAGNDVVCVEVREHTGTCKMCGRGTFERSALVTIMWAGRNLSREYVL